jgi:HK97 family phage portal protein
MSKLLDLYGHPIETVPASVVQEERGFIGASSTLANPSDPLLNALGVTRADSGENVTVSKALGLSAFWAGQRAISEDLASMTKEIIQVDLNTGTTETLLTHPVYQMLNDRPNREMNAFDFNNTLNHHAIVWGDGYAEIVRDGTGQPVELFLLDPTTVNVERVSDGPIQYVVRGLFPDGVYKEVRFDQEDIFHIKGPSYNGFKGYEIINVLKNSFGTTLANQSFSNKFFANNVTPSGVLEVPAALGELAWKHLRDSFAERHSGKDNIAKPLLLEEGTKWQQISTDPEKAQMIESMQFGIEEAARALRIPLSKLQHLLKANFNTLEMQDKEYEQDTLRPWDKRISAEIKSKLLSLGPKTIIAQHAFSERVSADQSTRTATHRDMFNIASATPDEIRRMEGQNPYADGLGSFPWIQLNMTPMKEAQQLAEENVKQVQLQNQKLELEIEKMLEPEPDPPVMAVPFGEDPEVLPEEDEETPPKEDQEDPEISDEEAENEEESRKLDEIQDAHQPLLEEVYKRILYLETDKSSRAIKKDQLSDWIGAFYGEMHEKQVQSKISPVLDSFIRSILTVLPGDQTYGSIAKDVDNLLKRAVKRHVYTSMYDLKEGSTTYWGTDRHVNSADTLLTETRNMLSVITHA